jgi:hypothetical protein
MDQSCGQTLTVSHLTVPNSGHGRSRCPRHAAHELDLTGVAEQTARLIPISMMTKESNHETCNNRIGNCICALEHGRAGASRNFRLRNFRLWIGRRSIGRFVRVAVGGLDERRADVEEHGRRSAAAWRKQLCPGACTKRSSHDWAPQVKRISAPTS